MGRKLDVEPTGTYFCFCAGTGVLPFMDLVGQLAFANLGILDRLGQDKHDRIYPQEFRLKIYVSFPRRSDAIGLDLFFALQNYCKRMNLHNFDLYLRLSKEKLNEGRWDEGFI